MKASPGTTRDETPRRVLVWCDGSYCPPAAHLHWTDMAGICSLCGTPHILTAGLIIGHYRRDLLAEIRFAEVTAQ